MLRLTIERSLKKSRLSLQSHTEGESPQRENKMDSKLPLLVSWPKLERGPFLLVVGNRHSNNMEVGNDNGVYLSRSDGNQYHPGHAKTGSGGKVVF
jgi:hypothetical protein